MTSPNEADPEVAALLAFEPVPRKSEGPGVWTPELQREFIARLAAHGSANKACDEMGKNRTGLTKVYNNPAGASFRAAWDGAVALARQRKAAAAAKDYVAPGTKPPTIDHRVKASPPPGARAGAPGDEAENGDDADTLQRRFDEARASITGKLLRARRLYLHQICNNAGKRAAFEILTKLPVDWDKARRLEEQPDEPWRLPNMREPDMLLTAEAGWLGEVTIGPEDRKAELRKAIDKVWKRWGRKPIDWSAE